MIVARGRAKPCQFSVSVHKQGSRDRNHPWPTVGLVCYAGGRDVGHTWPPLPVYHPSTKAGDGSRPTADTSRLDRSAIKSHSVMYVVPSVLVEFVLLKSL